MIANIFALLLFIVFIWIVVYCCIHIDDNRELPDKIENCLTEIEDLSMQNMNYDRIHDLCVRIQELQKDELLDAMKYTVNCHICSNKKCVKGTDMCEAEQWKKLKKKE